MFTSSLPTKFAVPAFVFLLSLPFLSAEKLGSVSIEEGKPIPFEKGLFFQSEDGGFIHVQILDHKFTAVFLDSGKNARIPDDVVQVIVVAESVRGDGDRFPFHLKRSEGGLYYSNPRHVYKPHQYLVQVIVKKEKSEFTPSRARQYKHRYFEEKYGFELLSQ